ncbi:hypothetical protein FHG87_024301 [Trinorchestia longiramus]|nr:hypothetical protein FHG87_024301 [Trinorchestia longiramus]
MLCSAVDASPNCSSSHNGTAGVHLVTFRWDEVGVYFTITAFVMFAGLGKLGFHQMHWLSKYVPESCLLIVLGVLMGLLVFFTRM